MTQKILFLAISIFIGPYCYSQCDKKTILYSKRAEILDEQDEVKITDTVRATTITYDKNNIVIISGNNTFSGTIDSSYCNWKIPFKEGHTYIKGTVLYANGDQLITRISITGKDGQLGMLVDIDHPEANKMRFVLNKFEETK